MWRHMRGVVRCSTTVLLQIFWRIFHWKNFENRLRFDWIMAMSLVCSFWPTLYFWTSLCGSMLLHFTEATSKLSVTVKVCSHFTTHKPNWTELQFWTLHSESSEQGEQSLRLLPQHLGRGSSAQYDRLTVMIINRWKSPAFVCLCFVPNLQNV